MSDPDFTTAYRGPEIPTRLGEQLQLALGLDDRPAVFGDWVEALAAIADRDDIEMGPSTLCTVDDSPHKATFNGQVQYYQCVQDPIILPFLAEDIDTVEIETESPVSGDPIELTVTDTEITAEPDSVVMSFGVAEDVEGPPDDLPSPILAYSRFCPYGHPFPSRDEYDSWAAEVDAVTMATSMEDTFELARALGRIAQ
ncbi:MAG: organomercurial lyase [Halobacteriales archaeon]